MSSSGKCYKEKTRWVEAEWLGDVVLDWMFVERNNPKGCVIFQKRQEQKKETISLIYGNRIFKHKKI